MATLLELTHRLGVELRNQRIAERARGKYTNKNGVGLSITFSDHLSIGDFVHYISNRVGDQETGLYFMFEVKEKLGQLTIQSHKIGKRRDEELSTCLYSLIRCIKQYTLN